MGPKSCCCMADALRFAPWLLIAVAVDPAAAGPPTPKLSLQSLHSIAPDEPVRGRREPILGQRMVHYEREALPDWTLPFGPGANDPGRRGFSFGIRPGRGIKARARIRF